MRIYAHGRALHLKDWSALPPYRTPRAVDTGNADCLLSQFSVVCLFESLLFEGVLRGNKDYTSRQEYFAMITERLLMVSF